MFTMSADRGCCIVLIDVETLCGPPGYLLSMIRSHTKRWSIVLLAVLLAAARCLAQDLAPRAYIITPVRANAVTLTYSFYQGDVLFDNTIPVTDVTARISVPVITYYHAFGFFGRSANITASLPYTVAHLEGNVNGAPGKTYRSGLMDANFRISVNLKGGPAMSVKEFLSWRQKTLLGASLKVLVPTGQYDPTLLINPGSNRWAFKPELGVSRRWGNWVADAYGAGWFFTTDPDFFSHNQFSAGTNSKSQAPIAAFEFHLSYDFGRNRRLWASLDSNFWYGGRTSLNGVESPNTVQKNSRIGGTASVPISKHQSLKVSYNRGAYITYGGNYNNVSLAWQYSWLGKP
jgi:hypothetical protein